MLYKYSTISLPLTTEPNNTPPICLSIDHAQNDLIASDSRGLVTLGRIQNGNMGVVKQWKAHGHEAWTVIFGHDKNIALTGRGCGGILGGVVGL